MGCVKYCSRFYFLGGQYIGADGKEALLHDIFPPNVYIYDPILQLLSPGVPMTTGKLNPLLFVVDHKLYVLGSLAAHDSNYFSRRPIPFSRVDELDSGIKHFEVFDISTGHWTALKDPPKLDLWHRWTCYAVVKRKVFILGSPTIPCLHPESPQLVFFNLDTQEWTKLSPPQPTLLVVKFTSSPELLGGDTFYGLGNLSIAKLGPFTEDELGPYEDKLFSHTVNEIYLDAFTYEIFELFRGTERSWSMCHLGERLFCFVRSSRAYIGCISCPDKYTRFIEIKLFKEEQEEATCININAENNKDSSFKGKYVHGANYVVKTSFSNLGSIGACYALDPEEKKKLKKKDE